MAPPLTTGTVLDLPMETPAKGTWVILNLILEILSLAGKTGRFLPMLQGKLREWAALEALASLLESSVPTLRTGS